jgi:hypothetical protein
MIRFWHIKPRTASHYYKSDSGSEEMATPELHLFVDLDNY